MCILWMLHCGAIWLRSLSITLTICGRRNLFSRQMDPPTHGKCIWRKEREKLCQTRKLSHRYETVQSCCMSVDSSIGHLLGRRPIYLISLMVLSLNIRHLRKLWVFDGPRWQSIHHRNWSDYDYFAIIFLSVKPPPLLLGNHLHSNIISYAICRVH